MINNITVISKFFYTFVKELEQFCFSYVLIPALNCFGSFASTEILHLAGSGTKGGSDIVIIA